VGRFPKKRQEIGKIPPEKPESDLVKSLENQRKGRKGCTIGRGGFSFETFPRFSWSLHRDQKQALTMSDKSAKNQAAVKTWRVVVLFCMLSLLLGKGNILIAEKATFKANRRPLNLDRP
jgi:hypothetical protein